MPSKVTIIPRLERKLTKSKMQLAAIALVSLIDQLEADQRPGDKIPNVGHDVYKVRLANPSAKRGKSGGFRVIYYIRLANLIYVLDMYSKTDQENITPQAIRSLIAEILANEPPTE
jgi:hypothetical protein